MDIFSIILFCLSLIFCLIFGINPIYSLVFGLLVFVFYALYKKFSLREIFNMCFKGFLSTKNVLIIFGSISILTGCLRCSGTIPGVVYYLLKIVDNKYFLLITFLLVSLMSFLTGSLLGACMTMGAICITLGRSLHLDDNLVMGAILSGVIVGDRMSPVSSSCSLVAEFTKTNIYENIKNMFKTSIIPFIITCIIYFFLGLNNKPDLSNSLNVGDLFLQNFNINFISILPMLSILILALFKVNIKINILVSFIISFFVCIFNENINVITLFNSMIFGYKCPNENLSMIINGGGLVSVLYPIIMVALSGMVVGIFNLTNVLDFFKKKTDALINKTSLYITCLFYGLIFAMLTCNQTLPVILITQMIDNKYVSKEKFANYIEDSAIVVPMYVPWNSCCKTCVDALNVGYKSIFFSYYVLVLVLYNLIVDFIYNKNKIGVK